MVEPQPAQRERRPREGERAGDRTDRRGAGALVRLLRVQAEDGG